MSALLEKLNAALVGFTEIIELNIHIQHATGAYELALLLANSECASITLRCDNVSNLRISEFGGGLTQVLALRVEDVTTNQLDRVNFHFADLERGTIAFDCSSAEVTK